jgi:type I restriction enzyme S subunit
VTGKRKLPAGWRWERLGEMGTLSQGGTPSTSNPEYWNGKIPFITGADVTELFVSKGRSFLTEEGLASGKTEKCDKGDLLIVSRTRVGRIGIADGPIGVSQDVSVIKLMNAYSPKYLVMYLKSISEKLEEACQGATIKGLTRGFIENLKIPLPPTLDDQIAIANELDRKMANIGKIRQAAHRQKEAIATVREAILLEAFPYKEGGKLPERWKWAKLGDLARLKNGINFDTSQVGSGILTLDVFNMFSDNVYPLLDDLYRVNVNLNGEYVLQKGDILFVRSSVKKEGVGWPTVFQGYNEPVTFCGFLIRARLIQASIFAPYLVHYFRKSSVRNNFISASGQSTITNINQNNLSKVLIPLPATFDDQLAIVKELERKMADVEKTRHAVNRQFEAVEALPGAVLREVFDFGKE